MYTTTQLITAVLAASLAASALSVHVASRIRESRGARWMRETKA